MGVLQGFPKVEIEVTPTGIPMRVTLIDIHGGEVELEHVISINGTVKPDRVPTTFIEFDAIPIFKVVGEE